MTMINAVFARDTLALNTLHLVSNEAKAYCATETWVVSDASIGRDDLLCGQCLDAYASAAEDGYDAYLKSQHWQHMRELAREHYGNSCCLCGAMDDLDVHHRTYERKGRERLSDLILLCRGCHQRFHAKAA